jgi:hypothetical protein
VSYAVAADREQEDPLVSSSPAATPPGPHTIAASPKARDVGRRTLPAPPKPEAPVGPMSEGSAISGTAEEKAPPASGRGLPPAGKAFGTTVRREDTPHAPSRPALDQVFKPTAAAAAAPVGAAASRPALDQVFQAPPRTRSLPKKGRLVLAGVGGVLVLAIAAGRCGASKSNLKGVPASISGEEMVVSEEDLKKRREVRPEEFTPKRQFLSSRPRVDEAAPAPVAGSVAPAPAAATAAAGADPETLEERRARRAHEEEPERAAKKAGADGTRGGGATGSRIADGMYDRDVRLPGSARPDEAGNGADKRGVSSKSKLAAASTRIAAVLETPVQVGGGEAATVVAIVAAGDATFPKGTRFIGAASLSGSRVLLKFRSLTLPDGREARLRGEAQDVDGAFGLAVNLPAEDKGPSAEREVAEDTAVGAGVTALGGGLLGGAARDYARAKRTSPRERRERIVWLDGGREMTIFVTDAVSVE